MAKRIAGHGEDLIMRYRVDTRVIFEAVITIPISLVMKRLNISMRYALVVKFFVTV
ncbi:MAG: hypothetical protein JW932_19780 [Deltaproteobacteria bacterium]|nr:hypothetical protein [Deltaproteobacteria bacterium]